MDLANRHEKLTVSKSRPVWQSSAFRLLREARSIDYARRVMPATVDDVHIQLPQTDITLGLNISVHSQRLVGQTLFVLLFQHQDYHNALRMGHVALDALHQARVSPAAFPLSGLLFRFVKGPRIALKEMVSSRLLSGSQKRQYNNLLRRHLLSRARPLTLVHGDLHASHIIVDLQKNTLGFIDFEAMHVGKASTNFAQLWIGYYYADAQLGSTFYEQYAQHYPSAINEQFDIDVRVELAMRAHRHIRAAHAQGNDRLAQQARTLLDAVLSGATFATICNNGAITSTSPQ